MHVATALDMDGKGFVSELLNHVELLVAVFTFILVNWHFANDALPVLVRLGGRGSCRHRGFAFDHYFDGLLEQYVVLDLFRLIGERVAVLVHCDWFEFSEWNGRNDADILNCFTAGGVIFGHREDDCGTIVHGDGFANRGIAVGAFTDDFGSLVIQERSRGNFAPVGRSTIDDDG